MTFNPNTNPTVAVSMDAAAVGRSSTLAFLTVYQTRNPTANDVNYPIQQRWVNTTNPMAGMEFILQSYSNNTGVLTANWIPLGVAAVVTLTLTGNTNPGVPVSPDGANNIGVYGDGTTINSTGNAVTNRVTFSTSGVVATSYPTTVAGPAIPVAGVLNVFGGTGVSTTGAGNTVTINALGTVPLRFTADGPSFAVPAGNNLNIIGGAGIATSGGGSTITIRTTGAAGVNKVINQTFTASGMYTPSAGMLYCQVVIIGGGSAGGGSVATGVGQFSGGGGGGAGEYASGIFTAAAVGAGQVVTIGAAGVGVNGANGGNGGNSSLGALITAFGATGGLVGPLSTAGAFVGAGGAGGTGGAGGAYRTPGVPGINGLGAAGATIAYGGTGASSQLGAGGIETPGFHNGNAALGYGSGGGGANQGNGGGALTGGNGTAGIIVITEYTT